MSTPVVADQPRPNDRAREVVRTVAVVAALAVAGRLGVGLATLHGNVSAVWPATGVAVWILLTFGLRLWPLIAVVTTGIEWAYAGMPWWAASGIAVGATAEALAGAWLWRMVCDRWAGEAGEAAACVVAALVAPVASATMGVGIERALGADLVPTSQYWITWWTGDAIGALALLPVLVAMPALWAQARRVSWPELGKVGVVMAAAATVCWLAFVVEGGSALLFAIFPVLLLAMWWFGAPGARVTALFIAVTGIAAEFVGWGFVGGSGITGRLLNMQLFLGSVAIVALVLPLFRTRGNLLLPVAVLLGGWTLSGWIFTTLQRDRHERQAAVFAERVTAAEVAIRMRMASYIEALRGGASLFAAAKSVSREDWHVYVDSLNLPRSYPSLNGFGVIFPVRPADLRPWLARMRVDGSPEMIVTPFPATDDVPDDVKYIITFVEPARDNRASIGRNIATEPSRRLAAELARDTGEPQMHHRIPGSRDTQRRSGFLLYVPLYRRGEPASTVAERRAAHYGWVYAQFYADNFLEDVLGPMGDTLRVHLFEEGGLSREHLLYASGPAGGPVIPWDDSLASLPALVPLPAFERVTAIEMAGQRFRFGWQRGPKYLADEPLPAAWAAVSFTFATLLLAGLVVNLQTTRERARQLAADRTRELAATQIRLQAVLDGADFSIISTTPDGVVSTFNAGAEAMLGYSAHEVKGRLPLTALHVPRELELRAAELEVQLGRPIALGFETLVAQARVGRADEREWTYLRKDGGRLPVILSVTALRDTTGANLGYLAIAQDLTERKKAALALLQSEQHLQQVLRHAECLVWEAKVSLAPQDWRWKMTIYASGLYSRMTGDPNPRPEAGLWYQFDIPEQAEMNERSRRAMESGETGYMQEFRLCRTGSVLWIRESVAITCTEPGEFWLVGVAIDITEQKRAEAALRESEARLRSLSAATFEGIVISEQGRVLDVNDQILVMLGLARDEAIGRALLDFVAPDSRALVAEAMRAGSDAVYEHQLQRRDGSVVFAEARARAMQLGTRSLRTTALRDITERKHLEKNLARARDEALEASRLKSEFLATISHEIRTPMNAVIGMAGLLSDTPLNRDQEEMARTILGGAENLLAIINDLLDFSRIEAGRLRLDAADFDFRRVVEETVALLAPRAHEKGLAMKCQFDSWPDSLLLGDSGRVRQVLTNLIGNAIKFTDAGEVSVRVRATAETASRMRVRVTVQDTGVGIPLAAQSRLFQPFTQADGSTTRRFGGTGLGLAISRQLTELMGGDIGFESEPGQGSAFWFELEFARRSATPSVSEPSLHLGRRILLVGHPAGADPLPVGERVSQGVKFEFANDGAGALARLRDPSGGPWDGVVIDSPVADMTGLELAAKIRSMPGFAGLPLVLLSPANRLVDRSVAAAHGIVAELPKPVTAYQLGACLARVLAPGASPLAGPDPAEALVPAHAIAPHRRLLVAEDNLANQRVAQLLLASMGYEVTIANDGEETLARLAAESFAAVLMDCQMPILDGYETSRRIRAGAVPGVNPRVPIIALTAYARPEDRARCLEAGMDDYVRKPILPGELRAALERCGLAPGKSDRGASSRSSFPANAGNGVWDDAVLAAARALPGAHGPSVLPELIQAYLADEAARLDQLGALAAQRKSGALGDEAHRFGGSAATFGAAEVRRLSLALEDAARTEDWPRVTVQLAQLRAACARLRIEIAQRGLLNR